MFCEKPLSLDLAECLAVEAEAARHPRLKVMIGYVRRFDASYQDAHAKIAAGAIGRPFIVRSQTTDMNDPSGFFVRFAPKSGGIFLDMSVHDIDAARWLLGAPKPKRVFSVGTIAVHEGLAGCGDVDVVGAEDVGDTGETGAITVPAGPTEQQLAVLSVRLEMAAVYLKLVGG